MQSNPSGSDVGDSPFVRSTGRNNAFSPTSLERLTLHSPDWTVRQRDPATFIHSASIDAVTWSTMDDSLSLYEDYRRYRSIPYMTGSEFPSLEKGDNTIVLLPKSDRDNNYLGTLGIFAGSNVQFLGSLKKPIKRLRVPRRLESYRPSMQMNNDIPAPAEDGAPIHQSSANEPEFMGPDNDAQAQPWTEGHEAGQWRPAEPAPAASAAEGAEPIHQASANVADSMGSNNDAQAQPFTSWTERHEAEQWRPAEPAHKDSPPAATSTRGQDEGTTRDEFPIDLMDVDDPPQRGGPRMKPPAPPERQSPSSAAMFTNAQVDINGGTFHNVAHVYESDAPACGGGSALQWTARWMSDCLALQMRDCH